MVAALLALMAASCAAPVSYLPEHEMVGEERWGAFIEVMILDGGSYAGELIAVGEADLIIREEMAGLSSCLAVPLARVRRYTVRYANGPDYGGLVPLYTLGTLTHGLWLIFSAPVNFLATTIIAVEASYAYELDSRKDRLSFEELKMFARFPQGLPPGVSPEMIQ
jgi:hypothetical protein